MKPLNGEKTHPLTHHALAALERLSSGAVVKNDFNPGVINRLARESLVSMVELPSPFKTHRGRMIPHLQITEAGKAALRASHS